MGRKGVTRRDLLRAGVTGAGAATSAAFVAACGRDADEAQPRDPGTFVLTRDHELLGADAIRERAIGNTLVGTVHDSEDYELYLRPDGVAMLKMEQGRTETGRWELRSNGEIVSQWPTIANGEQLVNRYYFDPASGDYMNLATNGLRFSAFRIEGGDSRGLGA